MNRAVCLLSSPLLRDMALRGIMLNGAFVFSDSERNDGAARPQFVVCAILCCCFFALSFFVHFEIDHRLISVVYIK